MNPSHVSRQSNNASHVDVYHVANNFFHQHEQKSFFIFLFLPILVIKNRDGA